MHDRIDVGAVIRRVADIYVDQAPVLMPAAAAVFVVSGILSTVLLAAGPLPGLFGLLITLVATTLFTGMIVQLVADVQDGKRDATPSQLLQAARPVVGSLIFVAFAVALGVVIGFFLLIVPGLILITVWSVAAPVVVLERPAGLGALRRSRELVKGNGWPVFGVIVVLFLGVGVLSGLIELAADSAGTAVGTIVRVVVGVLTAPIEALSAAVLYFELKRRSAAPAPRFGDSAGPASTAEANPDAHRAFGE